MRGLLEAGDDPGSQEIPSSCWAPCSAASVQCTKVSENILCLEFRFQYDASGPLVQQDSPAKQVLDTTQSFNVVFSSDRSSDRFTGKPVSQTTGLYYYYHRWYDPSIGRFISRDPYSGRRSDPQSLNYYVYVENSPVTNTDPSGKFINFIAAAVGAAAGFAIGYVGCGVVTGGWTSSNCVITGGVVAATGALAGLTFGVSLAVGEGAALCEEEDCIAPPVSPTTATTTTTATASSDVTTVSTSTIAEITNPTINEVGSTATQNLVDTSGFWDTWESSLYWNKGTFPTSYDSLVYHLNEHAQGLSAGEYTQDALNLRDALWSESELWRLRGGSGVDLGLRILSDFGAGQGGIFTLWGDIVTFWYGPPGI